MMKQWKQIIWNTSNANRRGYEPLNSKMRRIARARQLITPENDFTPMVDCSTSGEMQSQLGRGETMVVSEIMVPWESMTKLGFKNTRERVISLREVVVLMLRLQVVALTLELVQVYCDDGTPLMVRLMIYLILAISIQTSLLKVSNPQSCPLLVKDWRVQLNGYTLHSGVVEVQGTQVRLELAQKLLGHLLTQLQLQRNAPTQRVQLLAVREQVAQMEEQLLQVTKSDIKKVPSMQPDRQDDPQQQGNVGEHWRTHRLFEYRQPVQQEKQQVALVQLLHPLMHSQHRRVIDDA